MTAGQYLKLYIVESRMQINGKCHAETDYSYTPKPCDYGVDWQAALVMEAHARRGHIEELGKLLPKTVKLKHGRSMRK
jgi:hypothetical protein